MRVVYPLRRPVRPLTPGSPKNLTNPRLQMWCSPKTNPDVGQDVGFVYAVQKPFGWGVWSGWFADQAGVGGDGEGCQRPDEGLECPDGEGEGLPPAGAGVEVASGAQAC